jgi:hypothetical protein
MAHTNEAFKLTFVQDCANVLNECRGGGLSSKRNPALFHAVAYAFRFVTMMQSDTDTNKGYFESILKDTHRRQ